MSAFWLLSLLCLAFAFGVLVWTFVWAARLLARRARPRAGPEDAGALAEASSVTSTPPVGEDVGPEEGAEEEKRRGTGVNATLGLVLGILACLTFPLSPLTLAVSAAGLYFSGIALWHGIRRFLIVIGRAVAGLILSLVSVGLHYLRYTGGLPF